MNPQQILLQRLSFLLDPIGQFPGQARKLRNIHHDAVMKFRSAASLLTQPGTDILKGETAKAFDTIISEYLRSEALFTGAGTVVNTGGLEEAAVACETLQQEIYHATFVALKDHIVLDQMFEVIDAIDISAALQGFIDVPDDIVAAILTVAEAAVVVAELTSFLNEIYQAVQRWQYEIQRLADQPLPSLPPTPFSVYETIPN